MVHDMFVHHVFKTFASNHRAIVGQVYLDSCLEKGGDICTKLVYRQDV